MHIRGVYTTINIYVYTIAFLRRQEKNMKMMSLKIPNEIHFQLKRMAMEKGVSMSSIILEFIKNELNNWDNMMLLCTDCNQKRTIRELRQTDYNCPQCGIKVRLLRAGKKL
jgi:predicted RNA-binding Zn-ribbon protein involved in translation (DUF1610 family)